jgi:stearoyl-CoA desaturase (delta-9 desaturase)
MFGPQRFDTGEQSRNNRWLGFITGGEGGSHNNHHHKHGMESSAISFWEKCSDSSHYVLMVLHYTRIINIPKYKRRIQYKS